MKRALAVTLAIAACLFLLSGCRILRTLRYGHAGRYTAGGGTIDQRVDDLAIDWVAGSVTVKYHDGDRIELSETARRRLSDREKVHWLLDGSTLHIKYQGSGSLFSLRLWKHTPAKDLTVLLPRGTTLQELTISSVSAPVTVDGVIVRDVNVDTVSGDVGTTLRGQTRGLSINTVSGRVTAAAEQLAVFAADTTSGSVELASGTAPEDITVDTTSGHVSLYLPASADCVVKFDSVSGRFSSSLPFTADNGRRYTLGIEGTIYKVDTVSGSMRVEPLTSLEAWY